MDKQLQIKDGIVISRAWLEDNLKASPRYLQFTDQVKNAIIGEIIEYAIPLPRIVSQAMEAAAEHPKTVGSFPAFDNTGNFFLAKKEFIESTITITDEISCNGVCGFCDGSCKEDES